jgi:hypothetical protein
MGGKPDLATRTDRPESGGADKDMIREKSGLLERDKQKFATEEAEKRAGAPEQPSDQPQPFSVGHERNPLK